MTRQRLDPAQYHQQRLQVLARDRYQCQVCGKRTNLEVHHQRSRAHGGSDHLDNLITLCSQCHAHEHGDERHH